MANDPKLVADRWQEFFMDKLHCRISDFDSMAENALVDSRSAFVSLSGTGFDMSVVPSLFAVERLLAFSKKGRAFGEDGLPADLLSMAAPKLVRHYHPLVLKTVLRIEEPIAFRGGNIVSLFKGKGNLADCNMSRGIQVSDAMGKKVHSWYRTKMIDKFRSSVTSTQCGGTSERGTDLCAHIVRLFFHIL